MKAERAGARKAAGAFGVGDSKSRHFGAGRALTQAYLGVYVFAPRHAGAWLAAGSEEVSLGCDLRELRKEDLVLYRGEKALAGGGGGRWLGGSLLAIRQWFVLLSVGWDVLCAGSRHIPKVLAAEGGERPRGAESL